MNGLFSYESAPMQLLMRLGDLIILNILYLICCIPIFTIGAAQAGLHTGIKVLLDKEDDTAPSVAFFRGFSNGFGTITLSWGLMTLLLAVVVWLGLSAIALGAPKWLVIIAISFCAMFQSLIPAFHSRFGCTAFQLYRNCWVLFIAHPLRSIASAAMIWLPVIVVCVVDLFSVMAMFPVLVGFFYSTAFAFVHGFLKKPFKTLTDHFNETHGLNKPEEADETTDSESEEDEDMEYAEEEDLVSVE